MNEPKVGKGSSVSEKSSLTNIDDSIVSSADFISSSDSSGDVIYSRKKSKKERKETKKTGRKVLSVLSTSKEKRKSTMRKM
eukprot:4257894-Ditylum_brightwellii.AAC.1